MAAEPTISVCVQLLNEGTSVYRPTIAVQVGSDTARLLATDEYDPEDEDWEFKPGTVVRIERRLLSDGVVLVAVAAVE